MQWWLYGLFYGLLLAIGFAGGFYFSNALQKQIAVLLGAAVVVGFLTWIGSGADLVGLLREWYKERREEERVPKLVFAGEFVRYFPYFEGYMHYIKGYYVRIKKASGEGFANDCEGFLTISSDDIINYSPSVWYHADVRKYNIGGQMDLMLFRKDDSKRTITFPLAKIDQGFVESTHDSEDYLQSELTVHINTRTGKVEGNYSKSIENIIADVKQIGVKPPKP